MGEILCSLTVLVRGFAAERQHVIVMLWVSERRVYIFNDVLVLHSSPVGCARGSEMRTHKSTAPIPLLSEVLWTWILWFCIRVFEHDYVHCGTVNK